MAIRGRSQPIKPHYGYPPFVLSYPPLPAPVGKAVIVAPSKDDRLRGARCRKGVNWRGYPPFVLGDPIPPPVGRTILARPSRAHLRLHGRPLFTTYGYPSFVYPLADAEVTLSADLVDSVTLSAELLFTVTLEDSLAATGETMPSYNIGSKVRFKGTFANSSGTAVDPTTVTCRLKYPSGQIVVLTYAAGELSKLSTGVYYVDQIITQDGEHIYNFTGTGAAAAAEEDTIEVEETEF